MFLAARRPRAGHGGSKYTPTPPQHLNSTPPIHFYPLTLSHPPPSTTTHAPAAPPRKMDTSDFFVLVCVCVWFVFSFIYIRFVIFRQFCEFSRARAYIETGGSGCGRMGPIWKARAPQATVDRHFTGLEQTRPFRTSTLHALSVQSVNHYIRSRASISFDLARLSSHSCASVT